LQESLRENVLEEEEEEEEKEEDDDEERFEEFKEF